MITANELYELLEQGEGLHVEIKACADSLPRSIWETYSAFANTRGGVIILGVMEDKNKPFGKERFQIIGVSDVNKVITDFFNTLNNKQKVNKSILVDSDVRTIEIEGKYIIHITVHEADYRQKPIYINDNLQSGTFKRVHEGDRHVTPQELTMMIRDSVDDTDQQIIEHYGMDDIDIETLTKYRQSFKAINPDNAFNDLSDKEFLTRLGGYSFDRNKGIEGLTIAGLLMFGKSMHIHQNFPNFRVDYLDLIDIEPGESKKWNDRLTDDGRWEDNLYNFLTIAMRKLLFTLPSEGKLEGIQRKDGGLLHEAVREGMVNSITYTDYKLGGVLRIDRKTDKIVMRNPGVLRISPERIYNGDYTQARNTTIQKMLRMVGFGDNIGSGFTKIMKAWQVLGFDAPDIHEEDEVNEVWLILPLNVSQNVPQNVPQNVSQNVPQNLNQRQKQIIELIRENPRITRDQIALKLQVTRKTIGRELGKLNEYVRYTGPSKGGYWQLLGSGEKDDRTEK